jgi:transglutaminase-like putative cysteine protease
MRIEIEHQLSFRYDDFIRESWMELRAEPPDSEHQTTRSFHLAVGPRASVSRYRDWNGNIVHHFGVADYHDRLEVLARSVVDTHPAHRFPASLTAPPPDRASLGPLLDFTTFGGPIARSSGLEEFDRALAVPRNSPLGVQIEGICAGIRRRIEYRADVTDWQSTTDDLLSHGAGVCQDFAQLMLGVLRLREIACRYVSGYLHVERSDVSPSQSHAWIEVYAGDGTWVAFDPTHGQVPSADYVHVGLGRHYEDVPPNRGIYRGNASEKLVAAVHTRRSLTRDVTRLQEEVGSIEVPVFPERPHRATGEAGVGTDGDPQQQQQQQQQR